VFCLNEYNANLGIFSCFRVLFFIRDLTPNFKRLFGCSQELLLPHWKLNVSTFFKKLGRAVTSELQFKSGWIRHVNQIPRS